MIEWFASFYSVQVSTSPLLFYLPFSSKMSKHILIQTRQIADKSERNTSRYKICLFLPLVVTTSCCLPVPLTQHNGDVWPKEGLQRVCPAPVDLRHGNMSLIPLRGSENEMRNSVAAFSPEALAVSEVTNPLSQSGGQDRHGARHPARLIGSEMFTQAENPDWGLGLPV